MIATNPRARANVRGYFAAFCDKCLEHTDILIAHMLLKECGRENDTRLAFRIGYQIGEWRASHFGTFNLTHYDKIVCTLGINVFEKIKQKLLNHAEWAYETRIQRDAEKIESV